MVKFNIRTLILAGFAGILTTILLVGLYAHSRLAMTEEHAVALNNDAVAGLYQSALLKDALVADFLKAREAVGQSKGANRAGSPPSSVEPMIAAYEPTIFTETDREAFAHFKRDYAAYRSAEQDAYSGKGQADVLLSRYKAAYDDTGALVQGNQKRAVERIGEIGGQIVSLQNSMTVGFLIALTVALLAGYLLLSAIIPPLKRLTGLMDTMRQGDFTQRMPIMRDDELGDLSDGFNRMADEVMELVGQVQRSGIRVSTSMTEIAATSKQQQATAAEVAATTTQIGATSREIAVTSKELVRTMTDVAAVSEAAAALASGGRSGLAEMEDTMAQVMEAANSINAKLAVLNEKAGDINQVVTTITKVADQTNLLSLNAAIEAEKAGEYGRGFAVVSSEIRRLADQTAVATYDIEQMVKDIQSAVSASVMGMDKFSEEVRRGQHDVHAIGDKFSEIIMQVQALAPRFESVNEGMQTQATGAEQISEALVQLSEATQQTVESLRQSTSAIEELNHVSTNLHGSIARFKLTAA
ncbi:MULTISPECIES: methyl-accepting chemotaxis protein [unclassified Novosphingobium]|uniref:methyl-accepting chemotaxis protein n=1 Tax=unclassified Novosphingobium TaxID=2644732 RepID=UPI0008698EA8|nr:MULTISPECIES: methyl-accepting chemotaxis protein [unclassified Novosphingobium]MDR6708719.1 methyl-accepting chemotaxis protein WspA [Novosphingobium sp. 1748]ODU81914.1 MAG: chemotaxis protein [Novosphingobium sp. SCN 63-17]OJX96851.1 MAG: methyl-accepting chemotaxis protein [Novosphingobium sp. 63-713]